MTHDELYVCSHCDAQYSKWQGQCGECNAWGTIRKAESGGGEGAAAQAIRAEGEAIKPMRRFGVGVREIDSVLGGGLVEGSLTLLAGEPGIGKSTLILQLASGMLKNGGSALYVCGEESPQQVHSRIKRLALDDKAFLFLSRASLGSIKNSALKEKPQLIIVDSVQTAFDERVEQEPGNATQVRTITGALLQFAKESGIPIVLIGHVTKEGSVAGPRLLEHMVDVVLQLEGDRFHQHRLLRGIKNRFGPTNYVGVFEMASTGLVEVENPSALFLDEHASSPGSAVSAIMEGNRPFLVEIQALTHKTAYGYPKRTVSGFDANRLEVLLAVLSRRVGMKLDDQDVFINIVGGLKSKDPALDLAVALAVASSLGSQSIDRHTMILGEVGLGGEIRNCAHIDERIAEARRLGFTSFLVPHSAQTKESDAVSIRTISDALTKIGAR